MGAGFILFAYLIIIFSFFIISSLTYSQIKLSRKENYMGLILPCLSFFLTFLFENVALGIYMILKECLGFSFYLLKGDMLFVGPLYFLFIFIFIKIKKYIGNRSK